MPDDGVVDLEHEPGVDDLAVLDAQGVGERPDERLVALVELVLQPVRARRRDDREEAAGDVDRAQRRLEVVDVALHRRAVVGDRARAHPLDALARRRGAARVLAVLDEVAALADLDRLDRVVALVVLGERLAVEVGGELVHPRQVDRPLLDPADAVVEVGDPADLAELAVVDEVEPDVGLAADDVGDRLALRVSA